MAGNKLRRGGVAALGVFALGLSAVLGSSAAMANTSEYEYGNVSDIDGTKTGSLTVHKYEDQEVNESGGVVGHPDGSVTGGEFSDPISGVVFTAYPLLKSDETPIDLTKVADWAGLTEAAEAVAGSASCAAPAGYTLAETGINVGPTDTNGLASAELPIGAYVVCETVAPSTVTKRANPFLVTIPFPDVVEGEEEGETQDIGWLYDVHVFPKNTLSDFSKTIKEQEELGVGAPVTFTITGNIPDISPEEWVEFTLTDALDSRLDAVNPYAEPVSPAGIPGVDIGYNEETHTVIVRLTTYAWSNGYWAFGNVGGLTPLNVTVEAQQFTDKESSPWVTVIADATYSVSVANSTASDMNGRSAWFLHGWPRANWALREVGANWPYMAGQFSSSGGATVPVPGDVPAGETREYEVGYWVDGRFEPSGERLTVTG